MMKNASCTTLAIRGALAALVAAGSTIGCGGAGAGSDETLAAGEGAICTPHTKSTKSASSFEPGGFTHSAGPGGPKKAFTPDQLYQPCGYFPGGPLDVGPHENQHDGVTMFDGYLI